jgi:hypothetical protein
LVVGKMVNQDDNIGSKAQTPQLLREDTRSRSIENTLTYRISKERNVVTPMESQSELSKLTVRKVELSSGSRMPQEAKAASRKATGSHNRADREIPKSKDC